MTHCARAAAGLLAAVLAVAGSGSAASATTRLSLTTESPIDRSAVSTDGVEISYRVEGAGEPALVFVHGWACDRSHWDAQIEAFSPRYKVVAIDLAGHGRSGKNRKAWTIPAFGADIAAVLDKEGIRRAVLIGHSMGGSAIIEGARLRPDIVLALVGVDTFQDLGRPAFDQAHVDAYLRLYQPDYPAFAEAVIRSLFRPNADPALVDRIVRGMLRTPRAASLGTLAADMVYSPVAALARLRKPMAAVNSDMAPTNVADNRRIVPAFVLKLLTGVGHFLMMEAPAEFNRVLEETIRELLGPTSFPNRALSSSSPGNPS
jgi:pimeloyl-ACP methyl ester carboxylesterase